MLVAICAVVIVVIVAAIITARQDRAKFEAQLNTLDTDTIGKADTILRRFLKENGLGGTSIAVDVAKHLGVDDNNKTDRVLAKECCGRLESRFKKAYPDVNAPEGLLAGIFFRMVYIPNELMAKVMNETNRVSENEAENDEVIIAEVRRWTNCARDEAEIRLREYRASLITLEERMKLEVIEAETKAAEREALMKEAHSENNEESATESDN